MAIAISMQLELVGEHPVLEVSSLISEVIIKSPTITGVVPKDSLDSVIVHVIKKLSLFAQSCDLLKESLETVKTVFNTSLTEEWQHNAIEQDYVLECVIPDSTWDAEWLCTIQVIANCDEDEQATAAAVTPEPNKVPSNLH